MSYGPGSWLTPQDAWGMDVLGKGKGAFKGYQGGKSGGDTGKFGPGTPECDHLGNHTGQPNHAPNSPPELSLQEMRQQPTGALAADLITGFGWTDERTADQNQAITRRINPSEF